MSVLTTFATSTAKFISTFEYIHSLGEKGEKLEDILDQLEVNPEWNVVDLGCGSAGACPYADVLVDRNDWSSNFEDREFVVHDLNDTPLPFEDKQFDFSFADFMLSSERSIPVVWYPNSDKNIVCLPAPQAISIILSSFLKN